MRAPNIAEIGGNQRLSTNSSLYLGNSARQGVSYYGKVIYRNSYTSYRMVLLPTSNDLE